MSAQGIEVFVSYSHRDDDLREELITHLRVLERQEVIVGWHDHRIGPGREWQKEIDAHLDAAKLILLLVSSDFIASDYCYDVEMARAMRRHQSLAARVVPIILRPCDWSGTPFSKLKALPTDGRPVTGRDWTSRDEAFLDITRGLRSVAIELQLDLQVEPPAPVPIVVISTPISDESRPSPLSSDSPARVELRIEKDFDSFTDGEQVRLLNAIRTLLQLSGGIRIVGKKQGSIILTLEIPSSRVTELIRAVNFGRLSSFGVTEAWEVEETERPSTIASLEKMYVLASEELSAIASRLLEREKRTKLILEPDALINEAYLKLASGKRRFSGDKREFLAVASVTMRRILVDYARRLQSPRQGPAQMVELRDDSAIAQATSIDVLALDEALNRLSASHGRLSRVVELRLFGGLTDAEVAGVLGISERAVDKDWKFARLWLRRELGR